MADTATIPIPKICATAGFLTVDYQSIRRDLAREGWKSPQSYCNDFDSPGDFSAVYLFLLVDRERFLKARPAYVGMSSRLAQRLAGHPVMAELSGVGPWVQQWFVRVPRADLRAVEAAHIKRFDPPWNVIGRKRGASAL